MTNKCQNETSERLANFHKNGKESVMIMPLAQDVVWKQHTECGQFRRAWILFGVKNVELTDKKSPFGQPITKFDAVYRHCIDGVMQPVRHCANQTVFDVVSAEELHERAFELALSDLFDRTKAVETETVECWSLGIASNSPEFLENFATYAQVNSPCYGNSSPIKHLSSLRRILLMQASGEDLKKVFAGADVKFGISI